MGWGGGGGKERCHPNFLTAGMENDTCSCNLHKARHQPNRCHRSGPAGSQLGMPLHHSSLLLTTCHYRETLDSSVKVSRAQDRYLLAKYPGHRQL